MITKKVFEADGSTNRFLSDFIIKSEQFTRPYVFIYDNTLAVDGSEDVLQDGTTDQANWSYPNNLWRRGGALPTPKSGDLTSTDKWDVVDNSILFYTPPASGSTVWVEVATTSEEFGSTLTQPSVERAEAAATAAEASEVASKSSEVIATTKASEASASETIATTKASEALASANASEASRFQSLIYSQNAGVFATNANNSKDAAALSATSASTSATTATTQAGIATTKATEAVVSANTAIIQAGIATTKATYASTSASSASSASTSALSSASTATTKASEALTSATNAETSYQNVLAYDVLSEGYKNEAETSKNTAVSAASTATTASNQAVAAKDTIQSYVIPTEATYNQELLDGKFSSKFVASGTINKQDDANVFNTVVGNEYKMANTDRFVNFDGKILEFPTGTTVDMTNDIPEVTVQDQATDGLVVQSSVNTGDYVVIDKEELITNGMNLVDTTGWAGTATLSAVGRNLRVTSTGGGAEYASQSIETVIGLEYTLVVDAFVGTTVNYDIYNFTDAEWIVLDGVADGRYNYSFIASSTTTQFRFYATGTDLYTDFNNISVQLKSDIYRAKEDIPALTSLTDSRFEDRTQFGITNKILATRRNDGTIKTEVCFVDTAIEDCGNAHKVMTDNGYSKLSNGLYSKGTDIVTPLGTWSTLNKGAYHPVFNYFGTRAVSYIADTAFDRAWFSSQAEEISKTSDTFTLLSNTTRGSGTIAATGGNTTYTGTALVNTRPDSKFYDIIYPDQWIDLRIEANAVSEQDELNRTGTKAKSGQLDGIGGVVATYNTQDNATITVYTLSFENGYTNVGGGNILPYPFLTEDIGATTYITGNDSTLYKAIITGEKSVKILGNVTSNFTDNNATVYTPIFVVKTLPHPSSSTYLRTDWIGDPTNYPQAVKDRLASGLPMIGMNPLLVGQDGTSYIGSTLNNTLIHSDKSLSTSYASQVYHTISNNTYGVWNSTIGNIGNTCSGSFNTDVFNYIMSYTAKIPTTQVTDPKAVKLVGNYTTATNSHSIYKGNQLVPTGKVNVGNGTNGLESVVVENSFLYSEKHVVIGTLSSSGKLGVRISDTNIPWTNLNTGDIGYMWLDDGSRIRFTGSRENAGGETVVYTDRVYSSDLPAITVGNIANIYMFITAPTHSTLALDNSDSPAYKMIETIAEDEDGMAHYQVFAQEMVWDYTADGEVEFTAVNITTAYSYTAGEMYYLQNSAFLKYYSIVVKCLVSKNWDAATVNSIQQVGQYLIDAAGTKIFELWDGNGFGDDNTFSQLTNGTLTDDNANTVKTIVASTPLNKYIGEK